MSWVVRNTVVPASRRSRIRSLTRRALTGSSPAVGSSRKSSSGRASSARAKPSRTFMPFENWDTRTFASWARPTRSSSSSGLVGRARVEGAEGGEVLEGGELQVKGRRLEADADPFVEVRAVLAQVVAPHRDRAPVAAQQPDQDLLRGALAGAARAEEAEDLAGGNRRTSMPATAGRASAEILERQVADLDHGRAPARATQPTTSGRVTRPRHEASSPTRRGQAAGARGGAV